MPVFNKWLVPLLCFLTLTIHPPLHAQCLPKFNYKNQKQMFWIYGVSAVLAVGLGAFAIGRTVESSGCGHEGKQGRKGKNGPKGKVGGMGQQGEQGAQGAIGLSGTKGPEGDPGADGGLPLGEDELNFYFFNGSSNNFEVITGIVTTPEADQFQTPPIPASFGAFTTITPLPRSPIGVYHLTIITTQGGNNVSTQVTVLKNGIVDANLLFPLGPYDANIQQTINYVYVPTQN